MAADQKPQYVKDENFIRVYSNSARMARSPWDVSLLFGQTDVYSAFQSKDGRVKIQEQVEIVMSYQHAMKFKEMLDRNLKGPIPEPDDPEATKK